MVKRTINISYTSTGIAIQHGLDVHGYSYVTSYVAVVIAYKGMKRVLAAFVVVDI